MFVAAAAPPQPPQEAASTGAAAASDASVGVPEGGVRSRQTEGATDRPTSNGGKKRGREKDWARLDREARNYVSAHRIVDSSSTTTVTSRSVQQKHLVPSKQPCRKRPEGLFRLAEPGSHITHSCPR